MKAVKAHEVAPVACTKHCGLCLDTEVTENGSRSARSRVRDARRTLVASLLTGGQGLTMKAVKAHEVSMDVSLFMVRSEQGRLRGLFPVASVSKRPSASSVHEVAERQ